jgi:hypothetical protein
MVEGLTEESKRLVAQMESAFGDPNENGPWANVARAWSIDGLNELRNNDIQRMAAQSQIPAITYGNLARATGVIPGGGGGGGHAGHAGFPPGYVPGHAGNVAAVERALSLHDRTDAHCKKRTRKDMLKDGAVCAICRPMSRGAPGPPAGDLVYLGSMIDGVKVYSIEGTSQPPGSPAPKLYLCAKCNETYGEHQSHHCQLGSGA